VIEDPAALARSTPTPASALQPHLLQLTAELVQAHETSLWRYLRVLGCPANEAQDLAQETFLTLLRTPLEDRGAGATRVWLRATARNLYLAHCRRNRRSPLAIDAEAIEAAWANYEREDDGERYRNALHECLQSLPKRQHDLLQRQLRARLPAAELSAATGLAPEGARSLLRRIKQTLRDCVTRKLHDAP